MPYPTPIEWTDATWTTVGGCALASPECRDCYAMRLAGTRLAQHPLYKGTTTPSKAGPVFNGHLTAAPADAAVWTWPLRWRGAPPDKRLLGPDRPSLIFVDDMSDLFHPARPREQVDRTAATIVYSRHIGQLLTKRPGKMCDYFIGLKESFRWLEFARWLDLTHGLFNAQSFAPEATFENAVIPRLWLGFSAGGQRWFDERWPFMRALAAMGFVIFVSYEPALAQLELPADFLALGRRAQVIAGGESGPTARPALPDWFRRIRDQCAGAGVPFFFKQWGEWGPIKHGIEPKTPAWDKEHAGMVVRWGKKEAGRLLDGVEHTGFPAVETTPTQRLARNF